MIEDLPIVAISQGCLEDDAQDDRKARNFAHSMLFQSGQTIKATRITPIQHDFAPCNGIGMGYRSSHVLRLPHFLSGSGIRQAPHEIAHRRRRGDISPHFARHPGLRSPTGAYAQAAQIFPRVLDRCKDPPVFRGIPSWNRLRDSPSASVIAIVAPNFAGYTASTTGFDDYFDPPRQLSRGRIRDCFWQERGRISRITQQCRCRTKRNTGIERPWEIDGRRLAIITSGVTAHSHSNRFHLAAKLERRGTAQLQKRLYRCMKPAAHRIHLKPHIPQGPLASERSRQSSRLCPRSPKTSSMPKVPSMALGGPRKPRSASWHIRTPASAERPSCNRFTMPPP